MDVHKNAHLTPHGRERIYFDRLRAAKTVKSQAARGPAAPAAWATPQAIVRRIAALRRQLCTAAVGASPALCVPSLLPATSPRLLGRRDDARKLFERPISLSNDLGLLSEQHDPDAKRLLGNFPQAFSHIALINTAHTIARAEKPCEQRSGHKALAAAADQTGQCRALQDL
jgi:hypothetical protein